MKKFLLCVLIAVTAVTAAAPAVRADYISRADGVMYLFEDDGTRSGAYTGWSRLKSDGSKRRYYRDGVYLTGCCQIGSYYYFFDDEGWLTDKSGRIRMHITGPELLQTDNGPEISFTVSNSSGSTFGYGHHFYLETLEDGTWRQVPAADGYSVTEEAVNLSPEQDMTEKIDITRQYGELASGVYRIAYENSDRSIVSRSEPFELRPGVPDQKQEF